jgi:hypothetical protein
MEKWIGTPEILRKALVEHPTLDGIVSAYGLPVSKGTLSRILRGIPVSLWAENVVRVALGEAPLLVEIPACPDCGAVHHARCHGKAAPVAVVVSGQPRRRKPSKAIRVDPQVFAALDADRREHKRTWTEYLDGLLWDASH